MYLRIKEILFPLSPSLNMCTRHCPFSYVLFLIFSLSFILLLFQYRTRNFIKRFHVISTLLTLFLLSPFLFSSNEALLLFSRTNTVIIPFHAILYYVPFDFASAIIPAVLHLKCISQIPSFPLHAITTKSLLSYYNDLKVISLAIAFSGYSFIYFLIFTVKSPENIIFTWYLF